MNEITLEKALQDIKIVLEAYKGNYQEHVWLQQCYDKVLNELKDIKK